MRWSVSQAPIAMHAITISLGMQMIDSAAEVSLTVPLYSIPVMTPSCPSQQRGR